VQLLNQISPVILLESQISTILHPGNAVRVCMCTSTTRYC
jgi:hypothetical protein